jgi:hypothetical protein
VDRTKLGEQRIGGRRFQQGVYSLVETCRTAGVKPQRLLRIWTALVITSGRTWPDVTNMDGSSQELASFIRRRNGKSAGMRPGNAQLTVACIPRVLAHRGSVRHAVEYGHAGLPVGLQTS